MHMLKRTTSNSADTQHKLISYMRVEDGLGGEHRAGTILSARLRSEASPQQDHDALWEQPNGER